MTKIKSLSSRIARRASEKKTSQKAQNRAAFLALREDIEEALNDGWPIKTIWETLNDEGKIVFTYQAFRLYVKNLIFSNSSKESTAPTSEAKEITNKKAAGIKGFSFKKDTRKEDLI